HFHELMADFKESAAHLTFHQSAFLSRAIMFDHLLTSDYPLFKQVWELTDKKYQDRTKDHDSIHALLEKKREVLSSLENQKMSLIRQLSELIALEEIVVHKEKRLF
ncbi:hypothetical protein A2U01_0038978, partial [Trifolium medium]|nr:hypothetical protein [Trifolium medium]